MAFRLRCVFSILIMGVKKVVYGRLVERFIAQRDVNVSNGEKIKTFKTNASDYHSPCDAAVVERLI